MKFEYQYNEGGPKIIVDLHRDATLTEALEGFKAFLLAAGYIFEGDVEIVNDEPTPCPSDDGYEGEQDWREPINDDNSN